MPFITKKNVLSLVLLLYCATLGAQKNDITREVERVINNYQTKINILANPDEIDNHPVTADQFRLLFANAQATMPNDIGRDATPSQPVKLERYIALLQENPGNLTRVNFKPGSIKVKSLSSPAGRANYIAIAVKQRYYQNYVGVRLQPLKFYLSVSGSNPVSVKIEKIEPYVDNDGDDFDDYGVGDDKDQCPDEAGTVNGCPDSDRDLVPDKDDKCPTEPGLPDNDGCPCRDRDRDGICDQDDKCPDQAGKRTRFEACIGCPDQDGDGVCDKLDRCPDKPGNPDVPLDSPCLGCPDRDCDGIPDSEDRCPTEEGRLSSITACNGCPDDDNDGICNALDRCPSRSGRSDVGRSEPCYGCPDSDCDGIIDDLDDCPNIPGDKSNIPGCNGCPDNDRDGVCDEKDKCPKDSDLGDNTSGKCLGCPDTDNDGVCNLYDKCPNKSGSQNGCPPPDPAGRFEIGILASGLYGISDQKLESLTSTNPAQNGFPLIPYGGMALLHFQYNVNSILGFGLDAGALYQPVDETAFNSQTAVLLNRQNLNYLASDFSFTAVRAAFALAHATVGNIRTEQPFQFRFTPAIGYCQLVSENNMKGLINFGNTTQPLQAMYKSPQPSLLYQGRIDLLWNLNQNDRSLLGFTLGYTHADLDIESGGAFLHPSLPPLLPSLVQLRNFHLGLGFTLTF